MNKKVISIFFILLLVSTIAPVFSENNTTKNITVDGVTFELPQKYQGSSVGSDGHVYMLDSVFDFAIRSMYSNDYLVDEYGYAIEKAKSSEVVNIGSHEVYYVLTEILNKEVSYAFFASGEKIFCISWEGDSITPEIENMIEKTPDSSYSSDELSNIFDNANNQYVEDLAAEQQEYEYQKQDSMIKELDEISNRRYHFSHFGTHGFGFGSVY